MAAIIACATVLIVCVLILPALFQWDLVAGLRAWHRWQHKRVAAQEDGEHFNDGDLDDETGVDWHEEVPAKRDAAAPTCKMDDRRNRKGSTELDSPPLSPHRLGEDADQRLAQASVPLPALSLDSEATAARASPEYSARKSDPLPLPPARAPLPPLSNQFLRHRPQSAQPSPAATGPHVLRHTSHLELVLGSTSRNQPIVARVDRLAITSLPVLRSLAATALTQLMVSDGDVAPIDPRRIHLRYLQASASRLAAVTDVGQTLLIGAVHISLLDDATGPL